MFRKIKQWKFGNFVLLKFASLTIIYNYCSIYYNLVNDSEQQAYRPEKPKFLQTKHFACKDVV